ncbi:hypothetical protein N806_00965 [Rhodococcus sp. P27]|nr:hypothetical protein N806_00965 [Rhodococcus sp. P27]
MSAAGLDVTLAWSAVTERGRVHPDDAGDLVDQREPFVELFDRDELVLGARIGHNLRLVHPLIRLEDLLGFEASFDSSDEIAAKSIHFGGPVFLRVVPSWTTGEDSRPPGTALLFSNLSMSGAV